MISHNVYFSLHDNSESAQETLVSACHKYLSGHPGMVCFSVGRRVVEFQRDVNDVDFDVALNVGFADEPAHEAYQSAPRHFEFIEEQKSNWKNVRVFDSRQNATPVSDSLPSP